MIHWLIDHQPSLALLSFMAVVICLLAAILLTQYITTAPIFPTLPIAPTPIPIDPGALLIG